VHRLRFLAALLVVKLISEGVLQIAPACAFAKSRTDCTDQTGQAPKRPVDPAVATIETTTNQHSEQAKYTHKTPLDSTQH
jgi:hypothetical protein